MTLSQFRVSDVIVNPQFLKMLQTLYFALLNYVLTGLSRSYPDLNAFGS